MVLRVAPKSPKVAEHHVTSSDMRLIHRDWRIGSKHIIGGLQSSRMKHLNGLVACVREHRRYGHPCFVLKAGEAEPKLRLCVRWESEQSNGALLLEPRFLSPCQAAQPEPKSQIEPVDTTLTAKRKVPDWPTHCEGLSLKAIDEVEPTICHLSNASRTPLQAGRNVFVFILFFCGQVTWCI